MSRYFSLFTTESQYQAAVDTLDYPNVSLIDTTGDLHYAKYVGKEVADAPFGSILMAEVATNKLFYINNSEYNLTDFPLADYKPIAVCIYDKGSNANNETVFMSLQWVDYTALGHGKPSYKQMSWGFYKVDLSAKVPGIRDTGSQHISSRVINEAMKPLVTKDYSGTSITDTSGDGESTAFCTCWRYSTPGTSEGEWYLPSYYDMMKYQQNYASINAVITNVQNVAGISYLSTVKDVQWLAADESASNARNLNNSGSFGYTYKDNRYGPSVRPVFIAGVQEL